VTYHTTFVAKSMTKTSIWVPTELSENAMGAHVSKKSASSTVVCPAPLLVMGFAQRHAASPVCRTSKFNALSAIKQSVATRGEQNHRFRGHLPIRDTPF